MVHDAHQNGRESPPRSTADAVVAGWLIASASSGRQGRQPRRFFSMFSGEKEQRNTKSPRMNKSHIHAGGPGILPLRLRAGHPYHPSAFAPSFGIQHSFNSFVRTPYGHSDT